MSDSPHGHLPSQGGSEQPYKTLASRLSEQNKTYDSLSAPATAPAVRGQTWAFPAKYVAMETPPWAEKRQTLSALDPGQTAQVVIPITEQDVDTMNKKQDMVMMADFDAWLTSRYGPHSDPAVSEWMQKIYPEYYEARERENSEKHHIKEQWEMIQLKGPKSVEDLFLMYRVESDGDLKRRLLEPTGLTLGVDRDKIKISSGFKRGFYNANKANRERDTSDFYADIKSRRQAGLPLDWNPAGDFTGYKRPDIKAEGAVTQVPRTRDNSVFDYWKDANVAESARLVLRDGTVITTKDRILNHDDAVAEKLLPPANKP